MANRGDLVSTGRKDSMSQFLLKFKAPALVRIVEVANDYKISAPENFGPNSIFWIFEKFQQKRTLLCTKEGRILSVALDSPIKFHVVFRHTVGPPTTLKEIHKHSRSSSDVTVVMTDNPSLLLSNRTDLRDPVAYGELKILSIIDETCLLGHTLTGLTLESDVTFLSARAPISLEIVKSYRSKSPGEFRQWVDSLSQQSARLRQRGAPELSSTTPDIVLLTARIGENVNNSEHSCFLYSVNNGTARSKATSETKPQLTVSTSNDAKAEEQKNEEVDFRALKSVFETKPGTPAALVNAKPSKSVGLACKEKSQGYTAAKEEPVAKRLGFGRGVVHSSLSSEQNLQKISENKTGTNSTSNAPVTGKSGGLECEEKPQTLQASGNSSLTKQSQEEMKCQRSRSQENLLDVSEMRSKVGLIASAHSFRETQSTPKCLNEKFSKVLNLRSVLANMPSSDEDAYEELDSSPSDDTDSATNTLQKTPTKASTLVKESPKGWKWKKHAKDLKSRRPLPLPEKCDTLKVPESHSVETNVESGYLQIVLPTDDEANSYASLRNDAETSRPFVSSESSWKSVEKEWRKMKNASEIPREVDVTTLTVEEVGHCLRLLKMKKYVKKFRQKVVDGAVLVTLTETMLVETFKMDQLDARKIVMFSKENWRPSKK